MHRTKPVVLQHTMRSSTNIAAFCFLKTLAVLTDAQTIQQHGGMNCILNPTTQIMTATLAIFKNTMPVTRAYFTKTSDLGYVYAESECEWTGTGTDDDPFTISMDIASDTNQRTGNKDNCGMAILNVTEQIYEWVVYTQIEEPYGREGDLVFNFACSGKDVLTHISTQNAQSSGPIIELPTQVGTGELYFTTTSSIDPETRVTSPLNLGEGFYVRLRFQPDTSALPAGVDSGLSTWGLYCGSLFATPSTNYDERRVDLLTNQGCPAAGNFLTPDSGFTGVKSTTSGGTYYGTTGVINARTFPKDPAYPLHSDVNVYFVCDDIVMCWRPSDQMCIDRCETLSGRKKRDFRPRYRLVANVTIVYKEDTSGNDITGGDDIKDITGDDDVTSGDDIKDTHNEQTGSPVYLIPVLAGVGSLLVVVFGVLTVVCLAHTRSTSSNYSHQSNSVSSDGSGKYPYYSKGVNSRSDKMSRARPDYEYPRKY